MIQPGWLQYHIDQIPGHSGNILIIAVSIALELLTGRKPCTISDPTPSPAVTTMSVELTARLLLTSRTQ